ncbi:MAG TPA: FAD-dependent oxidoreductase, partial [Caldilineaceae bacterium]|nr:FAD-dependent oxidoreductase [Caldilineaceae bacterium]
MQLAVVGAGPAGLTAAYRLQQAGHHVEVIEALDWIGGRTHAEHFGPGHHCDTGAGWLATFYSHTLQLFAELGMRDQFVRPRAVRGAADLLIAGQLYPWSYLPNQINHSPLLSDAEKEVYAAYIEQLHTSQADDLWPDLAYDELSALDEFQPLGDQVVEIIMRSLFEGPWFARLGAQSAAHARLWLRVLQDAQFFQVRDGMDAPWLRIADKVTVHTGEAVEALHRRGATVELTTASGSRRYDGVVLAVPAPAVLRILATQPDLAPPWLAEVHFAPQVRVYAARQTNADAHFGVHLLPPTDLFSVEWYSGRHGAWGACPPDWQWGLVCTYGPTCAHFLDEDPARVQHALWE